jgi:hypothetical protein
MEVESLAALKAAFETWRRGKRHPREAIPAALMERACAASRLHGAAAVARATNVGRGRLKTGKRREKSAAAGPSAPTYSRVEVAAPATTREAFAEVEMPTGVKVRLFTQTGEALGLLTALLGAGAGGAR